jgi:hypothetical protein
MYPFRESCPEKSQSLDLSSSVSICDIDPEVTFTTPTNRVDVDNKDCVIITQSFAIYDSAPS